MQALDRPRFSIVICVHDRADRLVECLRSLRLLAGETTAELVVVCDGGDPGVREAASVHLAIPGWAVEWRDVPAGGPAKARNCVLGDVRGELILFLNDDVRCEAGLLAAHDALHRRRPGHAVMGNTRWAPEVIDSEFMHWVAHHDSFYYLIPDDLAATWEYFHTMNLSVDRRWFDDGHRFDESFPDPAFEDTELGYRLYKAGLRIGLAYDAVLYHVHHFTADSYIKKSEMRGRSARRFCDLYPEMRGRIAGEYEKYLEKAGGLAARLRGIVAAADPVDEWETRIARAFMAGFNEDV